MKKKSLQQNELTQGVRFSPTLDAAMATWEIALRAFQNEAGKQQRDRYVAATDSLGHAIAAFQVTRPALAEQLGLWFLAHQELWSGQEPDGGSRRILGDESNANSIKNASSLCRYCSKEDVCHIPVRSAKISQLKNFQ